MTNLEERHRRIMAPEMSAVAFAHLLRCAEVLVDLRHEDLHADQVLRMGTGRFQREDDVRSGEIELLRHRAAGNLSTRPLRGLAGEVDGASRLRDDGVREARWLR